jgi:hypothetical protein
VAKIEKMLKLGQINEALEEIEKYAVKRTPLPNNVYTMVFRCLSSEIPESAKLAATYNRYLTIMARSRATPSSYNFLAIIRAFSERVSSCSERCNIFNRTTLRECFTFLSR